MGDIADWLIERQIWGEPDYWDSEGNIYRRPRRTLDDLVHEALDEAKEGGVEKLNKGIIEW